jgi:hypothetical protein
VLDTVRKHAHGADAGAAPATHERVAPGSAAPARDRTAPSATVPPGSIDAMSHAEKIQVALHGNRDQRNAILRDNNRTLHPYVLKNPQLTVEDVLAIAKNPQMHPELLKQVADRKEWLQNAQIALALARNPKTPGTIAVRALDFAPADALRQIAKGTGAPPNVIQAARKKVLK